MDLCQLDSRFKETLW